MQVQAVCKQACKQGMLHSTQHYLAVLDGAHPDSDKALSIIGMAVETYKF